LSTTEAYFIVLTATPQEAKFLKQVLHVLRKDPGSPITIHEDKHSCIALNKNSMPTGLSEHMGVKCHFCLNKLVSGDIEVRYYATEDMLANVLTKPLANVIIRHKKLRNAIMGLLE
jgi:hypothetical protein